MLLGALLIVAALALAACGNDDDDDGGGDTGNIECVTLNIDGYVCTAGLGGRPPSDDLFENGFEDVVR